MANDRIRWGLAAGLLVVVSLGTPASAQFRTKPKKTDDKPPSTSPDLEKYRDEADEVLRPLTGVPASSQAGASEQSYWSIVLVAFGGDRQAEMAVQGHRRVVRDAGLASATIEKRDKATVIAYGQYSGPDDPRAVQELERVREMVIGGEQPFASALLSPPSPGQLTGSLPEFDLRNAKRLHGADEALYTLQVAIYGRGDRTQATASEIAENREAAERAAVLLRRDGELAFYYHAPERSMVTVGVFAQEDHDPTKSPAVESFELMQVRQRHPLNLLNGQGIRERIPGVRGNGDQAFRLQPSKLVSVPRN